MREFLTIAKAISDETRVRILMFLQEGELCVCQIVDALALAPSTVSKHMAILMQAGLVECRKDGRWHYYRLPGRNAPKNVLKGLEWVRSTLRGSPTVAEDARRIKAVLDKDLKDLCGCYKD